MSAQPLTAYSDEMPYGSRIIHYHVVPAHRSTLGISVHPDGHVEVKAPMSATPDAIRACVAQRARWIARQQRHFSQFVYPLPEKEYVAGETHLYLGGQYRLLVQPACQDEVKLRGRFFEVYTTRPTEPVHTSALLDTWYTAAAHRHLRRRFEKGIVHMRHYGIGEPDLVIRAMKNRWGSCSPSRRVLLNRWLILAPTFAIDYVIIHELCHLVHPHHGAPFYNLLDHVLPDWQRRKKRLDHIQF